MTALAADLGIPASTVRAWRKRGAIPPRYWAAMVASAERHGIRGLNYDILSRIATQTEE
jgi:hypothetical protein